MTDTTSGPLNKLVAWDGNVRKTAGADSVLAEVAASIAAHGLLNNLVVRKDRKGKHEVIAGGRRLAALFDATRKHYQSRTHEWTGCLGIQMARARPQWQT
jgi:hypothetical protein